MSQSADECFADIGFTPPCKGHHRLGRWARWSALATATNSLGRVVVAQERRRKCLGCDFWEHQQRVVERSPFRYGNYRLNAHADKEHEPRWLEHV